MIAKNNYIANVNLRFNGKAKELLLKQIDLFYNGEIKLNITKYSKGDYVFLKKGTFIHGIFGDIENFDYTVKNGFISTDFTMEPRPNKIKNSVGMWNIKEDIKLIDYIKKYSGFTVTYSVGRGPDSKLISELIPYHEFDKYTEELNNKEEIWTYWGDKTKEVSFIPSLVSNKRQIAFILNTNSEYARKLIYADVWNNEIDNETIKPFIDDRYFSKFIEERKNRNASTTDRESAIMFGLPISLVEGIFVGKKIEEDRKKLKHIKGKLPNCYICNLEGKVIIGN